MTNELMSAAFDYAARGWSVFPLLPGKKIPMTEHGVKDATTDADAIRVWWTKTPTANIGLACGRTSGVYVVDIDRHGDTDGFVAANTLGLPATLTATTPNGGEHRFYVWTTGDEPQQAQKVNGHVGIDVRANGGYVVVAPSVVDGRRYAFVGDVAWNEQTLAEYPLILKKRKPTLFPWQTAASSASTRRTSSSASIRHVVSASSLAGPNDQTSVLARASAYLATMDAAIQGAGGHNALLRAAEALVVRFALPDSDALDLLWNEFNPRCVPPWDRANQHDVRDFERKVSEARKHPQHPEGDLRDEDDLALELSAEDEAIADRLCAPLFRRAPAVVKPDESFDRSIWSEETLNPPGFIGEVAAWIRESAFRRQPVYALGGAIALASAMLARRVTDEYNTRTNLYCALIGPSSSGKDFPLKTVTTALSLAGGETVIGSDVTCDTVIETDIATSPAKIYAIDEAGYFFSSIADASGEASYRKSILSTFMKLFSSANSLYLTKGKVGKPRVAIKEPCVSIICNSTPRKMYSSIRRDQLEDGWIPRCLFFISDRIPEKTVKPASLPSESIVRTVRSWLYRFSGEGNLSGVNGAPVPLQMVRFHRTDDARRMLEDYDRYCDEKLRSAGREGNECDLLYGKSAEIVARLALVQAASRDFHNTTVTPADVQWAISVAKSVVMSMRDGIESHVADSETEKQQKSILRVIEQAGGGGVTKTDLWRRVCRGLDKRRKEDLLKDLIENQHLVTLKKVPGETKSTTVYIANKEVR